MINEFITEVGNKVRDTLGSWFSLSWIPEHWFWFWWLFVLGLFCAVVIFFFGWSKIVRMVSSLIFLAAAIFVAGGYVMSRRIGAKEALQKAKEKQRQAQQRPRPAPEQERWKWPWEQ